MADTVQVPTQVLKPDGAVKQDDMTPHGMPLAPNRAPPLRNRARLRNPPHRQPPAELPLEEAAKREMQALPSKTPVSVLQELLSRRGTTPKYELVQVEGAIHEPTFRYRVTVADVVAMGIGRSKKEAKHAAAKNVLDKLIGQADPNMMNSMSNSINEQQLLTGNMVSPYEDKIGGNPIGLLQELCMSRRWPPPTYQTEHEEGLPHERQFTIACLVFKFKEIGMGKSKKLAKRQAANKMWSKLKDLSVETNNISFSLEDDDETVVLKSPGFNYVQFLQEIASEQQFEVTYVDIEEKSITGKYQCLVQLSTLPVAVCHGSGTSSKEAQTVAAHNALEYLKIMTKK